MPWKAKLSCRNEDQVFIKSWSINLRCSNLSLTRHSQTHVLNASSFSSIHHRAVQRSASKKSQTLHLAFHFIIHKRVHSKGSQIFQKARFEILSVSPQPTSSSSTLQYNPGGRGLETITQTPKFCLLCGLGEWQVKSQISVLGYRLVKATFPY